MHPNWKKEERQCMYVDGKRRTGKLKDTPQLDYAVFSSFIDRRGKGKEENTETPRR